MHLATLRPPRAAAAARIPAPHLSRDTVRSLAAGGVLLALLGAALAFRILAFWPGH